MFSNACKYAIKATILIASFSIEGKRVGVKQIAESIDSPIPYTAKILQQLVKFNVINSIKGPNGGFGIDPDKLNEIKIAQIVFAIDGEMNLTSCGLGLSECDDDKPCPIHFEYQKVKRNLRNILDKTTLKEFTEKLNSGQTFLKV